MSSFGDSFSNQGFIIELDHIPAGLARALEDCGAATIASRTVEGLYVEPAQSLAAVLRALEAAGVGFASTRSAQTRRSWARPAMVYARTLHSPLRNPRSACWLPVLPAA